MSTTFFSRGGLFASQFKPGASPNPGGKPKAEADTKSYPPDPKRDSKQKNAASTVGKVAANLAGLSRTAKALRVELTAVNAGNTPKPPLPAHFNIPETRKALAKSLTAQLAEINQKA